MAKAHKIVIVSESNSDNIGDVLIERSLKQFLTQELNIKTVLSLPFANAVKEKSISINSPRKTNRRQRYEKIKKNTVYRLLSWLYNNIKLLRREEFKCANLVIIGGGQLILSNNTFPYALFVWCLGSKLCGKKVMILSVGAGESFTNGETFLIKTALKLADYISFRDMSSIHKAQQLFGISAKHIPDLAYTSKIINCQRSESNKTCVICITDYAVYCRYRAETNGPELSHSEYLGTWAAIYENAIEDGYSVKFAWTTHKDKLETENLLSALKLPSIGKSELTLNQFIEIIESSTKMVSGRMHALIIGHLANVEVIPYIISKKIYDFNEEYLCAPPKLHKDKTEEILKKLFS
ncbi:MAG: polysaccharide pyruvyl transferase family protein [Alphaproteobacteria bacterium]